MLRWTMVSASRKLERRVDPTHYPIHDDVGEGSLQTFIAELLRPMIERYLAERGTPTFVGADQFIYYEQHNSKKCVAPDVYVIPGVPPGKVVGCWKTWEGVKPSFAFEIVSADHGKDYLRSPPRYDAIGVAELVIFDPEVGPGRHRWQVLRRVAGEGLVCVIASNADRVRSRVLGCWLRVVGEGESMRVRIATGPRGDTLVATPDELAACGRQEAARAREEAARAREEAARAQEEAARLRLELGRVAPASRRAKPKPPRGRR